MSVSLARPDLHSSPSTSAESGGRVQLLDSLDDDPASVLGFVAVGDPDGDDVGWLRLSSRLSSRNLGSSLVLLEVGKVLESRPSGTVLERNESRVVVRRSLGEDSDDLRVVESCERKERGRVEIRARQSTESEDRTSRRR